MTKYLSFSIIFIGIVSFTFSQQTNLSSGKIISYDNFPSQYIASRKVEVWLPENYNTKQRFSVIYIHDGQMLFDINNAWNKQEWKADETTAELIKNKKIQNCIIVAIWNNGEYRISEYFPDKIFNRLEKSMQDSLSKKYLKGNPRGDLYLQFITKELKPFIDKNFSTKTDKENTFMIGSSMGALISLYALGEYPDTFGGAACMSTAWLSFLTPNYEIPLETFNYLKQNIKTENQQKIYLDYGTKEADENHLLTEKFAELILHNKNIQTQFYAEPEGEHNEIAWARRLHKPLEFLLIKNPEQKTKFGKIERYEDFNSQYVTARHMEVWLPENYSSQKKYAVLYMHDGQMLFDAETTWNKQSWSADSIAAQLMKTNRVKDFIIVGIWNGGKTRHKDYFPQKPFETLSQSEKNWVTEELKKMGRTTENFQPISDNYLKFIVKELKPFIDTKYSVKTDKNNTFIAGSSMGGLISMYALLEYSDVFGGAACLSTHWPGVFSMENNPIPESFFVYLEKNLPKVINNKLYFDYGDKTLDALYPPLQEKVDVIMEKIKQQNKSKKIQWQTHFFPNANHSENAWKQRLQIPLEFLLKP